MFFLLQVLRTVVPAASMSKWTRRVPIEKRPAAQDKGKLHISEYLDTTLPTTDQEILEEQRRLKSLFLSDTSDGSKSDDSE